MKGLIPDKLLIRPSAPAGINTIHESGIKAQAALIRCIMPEGGFYTIPAQCRYWDLGISMQNGSAHAMLGGRSYSVNVAGYLYAMAGTAQGDSFVATLFDLLKSMQGGGYFHE